LLYNMKVSIYTFLPPLVVSVFAPVPFYLRIRRAALSSTPLGGAFFLSLTVEQRRQCFSVAFVPSFPCPREIPEAFSVRQLPGTFPELRCPPMFLRIRERAARKHSPFLRQHPLGHLRPIFTPRKPVRGLAALDLVSLITNLKRRIFFSPLPPSSFW